MQIRPTLRLCQLLTDVDRIFDADGYVDHKRVSNKFETPKPYQPRIGQAVRALLFEHDLNPHQKYKASLPGAALAEIR